MSIDRYDDLIERARSDAERELTSRKRLESLDPSLVEETWKWTCPDLMDTVISL